MNPKPDQQAWSKIRLLACDVDGTLTDGGLSFSSEGAETKHFHVRDGYGLVLLRSIGVTVAWISGRDSKVTSLRAAELRIPHLRQPIHHKDVVLRELAESLGLDRDAICYIGDDTNDLPAFPLAAIACAPADAHPEVLAAANFVTASLGGRGAVRDVCDQILSARRATASG